MAVTGGLLLFRERDVAGLVEHPERLVLGGVAATVAAAVLLIGVRRRRALAVRPAASADRGRREVIVAGAAILVLTGLVLTHLLVPLLD